MMFPTATKIYCDGGVIGRNPSTVGGTWAYVLLEKDVELYKASGSITPADIGLPVVTNNVTELFAAVKALEMVPDKWSGHLITDSQVTLRRLMAKRPSLKGVPKCLVDMLWTQRNRAGRLFVQLVKGHPTIAQLAAQPHKYSRWNVLCDKMCGVAARRHLDELENP